MQGIGSNGVGVERGTILYAKTIKILFQQSASAVAASAYVKQALTARDAEKRMGRQLEFDWPFVILWIYPDSFNPVYSTSRVLCKLSNVTW